MNAESRSAQIPGYSCMGVAVVLLISLIATGCTRGTDGSEKAVGAVRIANPASEYCVSKGGRLQIRRDEAGNETGMCHLPDGSVVEEWELFRRENPPPAE